MRSTPAIVRVLAASIAGLGLAGTLAAAVVRPPDRLGPVAGSVEQAPAPADAPPGSTTPAPTSTSSPSPPTAPPVATAATASPPTRPPATTVDTRAIATTPATALVQTASAEHDELPLGTTLATDTMLIGTRAHTGDDGGALAAMNAWQGKSNAVVQTYVRSDASPSKLTEVLDAIWAEGAVPVVSYDLQVTNALVTAGVIDDDLEAAAVATKRWLSGADRAYGTADDRRVYFRPAWEMNGNWYRWSPCSTGGGTAEDYREMWRYLHGKFSEVGIDRTRMAWVYSVNAGDWSSRCTAEALYPGDAVVDWTGIDGYTFTSTASPSSVFTPMAGRLRALAPTKPLSINEWGADSATSVGKARWVADFFLVAHGLGVQMTTAFNVDKERDWAVFGGANGDETFRSGGTTYRAWSTYRTAVADPRVLGVDPSNRRLLTNAQFLGRAET